MQSEKMQRKFAENLKYMLESNSMTQSELAFKIGVSEGAVSCWCNGRYLPSLEKMIDISEMFGWSLNKMLR